MFEARYAFLLLSVVSFVLGKALSATITDTPPAKPKHLIVDDKDLQYVNMQCFNCIYFPSIPNITFNGSNEECKSPHQSNENSTLLIKYCWDSLNLDIPKNNGLRLMDIVGKQRFQCVTTIGKGAGDKNFYVRTCQLSENKREECKKDFDFAESCSCIYTLCNASQSNYLDSGVLITLTVIASIVGFRRMNI